MDENTEYIEEAMEMLHGTPVVEFQPPSDTVIRDEDGQYHTTKTPAWVKFSTAFRSELARVKGAALSVYVCLGLHVNSKGKAWPSIATICKETGYESEAVTRAIKTLKRLGLVRAEYRAGTSNQYTPTHVAYGKNSTPPQNTTPLQKRKAVPPKSEMAVPPKSENKEEPLEAEPKKKNHLPAAANAGRESVYKLAVEIANVCGMDFQANKGRLLREARLLEKATPSPTPELIRESFSGAASFWASDWRGAKGQRPTPATIREVWGRLLSTPEASEVEFNKYNGYYNYVE